MITIVWDRDDVLNDLMRCWLQEWWKPSHPDCRVGYEDLTENPPHRILGVSLEEYVSSLDEFRISQCAADMEPTPEVLDWFKDFGREHRHMVLTATSLDTAPSAASWTFRHFGKWIQSFHLLPAPRGTQFRADSQPDKGAYLRWLGKGDVLVDDSKANVESARANGLAGVVFPRPWNGLCGNTVDALASLRRLSERTGSR